MTLIQTDDAADVTSALSCAVTLSEKTTACNLLKLGKRNEMGIFMSLTRNRSRQSLSQSARMCTIIGNTASLLLRNKHHTFRILTGLVKNPALPQTRMRLYWNADTTWIWLKLWIPFRLYEEPLEEHDLQLWLSNGRYHAPTWWKMQALWPHSECWQCQWQRTPHHPVASFNPCVNHGVLEKRWHGAYLFTKPGVRYLKAAAVACSKLSAYHS